MTTTQKLALHFNSGTGGHYALWIMLLGTEYRCKFKNFNINNNHDLRILYNYFWKKQYRNHWAGQEIEIDTTETLLNKNINKKVFLFSEYNTQYNFNHFDINIVIYTDVLTQCMLSVEKQTAVGIFSNISQFSENTYTESVTHLSKLIPCVEYQNKKISSYYYDKIDINKADAAFDLVDLVKQNGMPLLNYLNYHNKKNKCCLFTNEYIGLHSESCRALFQ
jgi:hypothetical protein